MDGRHGMGRQGMRRCLAAALAAALLALLALAPHLHDPAELVRLRNALLLDAVEETRFDWTPADMPADFLRERMSAPPAFRARVAALGLESLPTDWDRALALGRHMLAARRGGVGGAIQSDLETTYTVIRRTGEGYCGDYADVFSALALAAGLNVRSWAFSFDGFGGSGHIFNEVWDASSGRWRMIDVFHNYHMSLDGRTPLSALEFRAAMRRDPHSVRLHPIDPGAAPVFRYEDRARLFYQRGLDEWYLWWGNDVYSYERAPLVRVLGAVSRPLEQLGGIVQDVHPHIRVLAEEGNRGEVRALQRLKWRLWAAAIVFVAALVLALACLTGLLRQQRRRRA